MKLTDKLISLRKESGLTQTELAEKLTVSRQTVSNWELGEAIPTADNLGRLGELYGVSMDYLMNDGAERPTAAVAVMEKPKPEKPWRKPVLIAIMVAFVLLAFFAGRMVEMGKNSKTPSETTIPISSLPVDTLNEEDFEGTADIIGW